MRAINHALTGAVIGFAVPVPVLAIPLAVASHFALDAVPHFGINRKEDIHSRWFACLLVIDALLCTLLVAILFMTQANHWLLASICAFAAASPDLLSAARFVRAKSGRSSQVNRRNPLLRFHHDIQRELPLGAVTEVCWLVAMTIILTAMLRG